MALCRHFDANTRQKNLAESAPVVQYQDRRAALQ